MGPGLAPIRHGRRRLSTSSTFGGWGMMQKRRVGWQTVGVRWTWNTLTGSFPISTACPTRPTRPQDSEGKHTMSLRSRRCASRSSRARFPEPPSPYVRLFSALWSPWSPAHFDCVKSSPACLLFSPLLLFRRRPFPTRHASRFTPILVCLPMAPLAHCMVATVLRPTVKSCLSVLSSFHCP